MICVGQSAPDFKAQAIVNNQIKEIKLSDFRGKNCVVFFYPLDFTFVCPTELHAFQDALADFRFRNTEIIGVSVDSVHSHLAWLKTPKIKGGIEGITYPLISDISKKISRDYSVLDEEKSVALRGLFLIDKRGIVQHASINNLGLGRNTDEVLRLVDALTHHENHGEVCPANWSVGKTAMTADQNGLNKYFNQ